jgi:hypothetical protein
MYHAQLEWGRTHAEHAVRSLVMQACHGDLGADVDQLWVIKRARPVRGDIRLWYGSDAL